MLHLLRLISSWIVVGNGLLVGFGTFAAEQVFDLPSRTNYYNISYFLNDDGTSVESREWSATVLKPAAIEWLKRTSIEYSTSVQNAEIIGAYTMKADGRRIEVPKDNYQLNINKGRESGGPVFSDRSSISVVFPDVAVGDTVVFSYRIAQTEAIFPKHFSVSQVFSKQAQFDKVRVRIEYPASLWVQYRKNEMKETVSAPAPERKLIEWEFENPQPLKTDRRDFSVFHPDQETGFAFSTFKNYSEIASAYGNRALPKAVPTDAIRSLAAEIVSGKTNPRDQARAIYDWVSTKITYGGNCVGIGAVVPHDLSFVIENKMGDCKDHATLLQALLAARGIKSMQALINAGTIYELPIVPVVSNVNHVINYLPDFDLFVDSTSNSTPFGMLPGMDRGKPVLLVDRYKEGARTPTPSQASEIKTRSKLKIDEEGTLSGYFEVSLKGDAAASVRSWARSLTREAEEDFVKNAFRSMGLTASGKLIKDDSVELLDTYKYKVILDKVEKFLKLNGGGAFYLYPVMGGGSIHDAVPTGQEPTTTFDTACTSGAVIEDYVLELPNRMKVLSVPPNLKASNSFQSYQASYTLIGKILTAKRIFIDTTPTSVCSPEISSQYSKLGEKVRDNLKTQILFR